MMREQWLEELKIHITNKNLLKHCLAAEAIMSALAEKYVEDQKKWGLAGLLHDIDYDQTKDDPENHAKIGAALLREKGIDEEIAHAIEAHNTMTGVSRDSLMDKALYAVDPLTGLIVAGALIHPSKTLAALDVDFLVKRFHEKSFAKGANRQQIASCSEFDMSLEEFCGIGLMALQGISKELGL